MILRNKKNGSPYKKNLKKIFIYNIKYLQNTKYLKAYRIVFRIALML